MLKLLKENAEKTTLNRKKQYEKDTEQKYHNM